MERKELLTLLSELVACLGPPGEEREVEELTDAKRHANEHGIGRELFGGMRKNVLSAEEGAITWL